MRTDTLDAADLFCGAGGTSEGLARACARASRKLNVIAVNHWDVAIEAHRRNHPEAKHVCAALEGLNPRDLVPSGRLGLLVASPECTNHSVARGGRPINDQSRASAWLILKWLQELYVDSILIENVKEFQEWGPLGANGKPLKSKKGDLFRQFIETLRSLGYAVEWRVLNAANYGDPTTRHRLFIIGRRGRNRTIPWPDATHAPANKVDGLFITKEKWRSAREIIDWSTPGTSIFRRKRPLAMKTLQRIYAGMQKFNWPEPFLVILRQHMGARSVNEPLPTLTAGGTHVGLCQPVILGQQTNAAPRSVDEPSPTVATAGAISLIMANRNNNIPRCVDDPIPTLCTGNHIYKVDPFLTPNFGERDGQSPVNHGTVDGMIVKFDHQQSSARARSLEEPCPTITTKNGLALVLPQFAQASAKSVDEPLGTVTTTSRGIGMAQPFVAELRKGKTAASIEDPLSTVTTAGAHHGIVDSAFIAKYYGSGVCVPVDEPLDTVTARDRFGLVQIGDIAYEIDILFRMLRPRELARAQGFPDTYDFSGNTTDATKLIGNAVPCNTAEALCWGLIQ